jgi:hypothetical protein
MFLGVCLSPPCVVTEFCALGERAPGAWGAPTGPGAGRAGWPLVAGTPPSAGHRRICARACAPLLYHAPAAPQSRTSPHHAPPLLAPGSLYDVLRKARRDSAFAARLTWNRRLLMALDAGAPRATRARARTSGTPRHAICRGAAASGRPTGCGTPVKRSPGREASQAQSPPPPIGLAARHRWPAPPNLPPPSNVQPTARSTRTPTKPPSPRNPPAAKGMLYLHSHRPTILHRDLKSPNLLVAKDWRVQVRRAARPPPWH